MIQINEKHYVCVSASCSKPSVQDGTVSPDSGTINSGSNYDVTCKEGFTLSGSSTITCTNGQLTESPTCNPCESLQ